MAGDPWNGAGARQPPEVDEGADEVTVARLVETLFREAMLQRASDIHLEPMVDGFRIRLRVDGRLRELESLSKHLHLPVISRLKLMAHISLAEKRLPQDGRIRLAGRESLDVRVSTLPSSHGETIVMRLLDRRSLRPELAELGMWRDHEDLFTHILGRPDGIFLVSGPTGSGKTTTLYAALNHLNRPDCKIITVEDPVEYQLDGINQVRVRRDLGLDFGAALRSILRQAPNVIMIGEIRDRETAAIALNAALTGHQVFSTLHTNDAVGAPNRLIDLGVAPFLVAASLRAVMAQRLVRTVCPDCAERVEANPLEANLLGPVGSYDEWNLLRGTGCSSCRKSGYHGRKGIFEILTIDSICEGLIHRGSSVQEIRQQAREQGMRTLREDGLRKVRRGWTTLQEVLRVTVEG